MAPAPIPKVAERHFPYQGSAGWGRKWSQRDHRIEPNDTPRQPPTDPDSSELELDVEPAANLSRTPQSQSSVVTFTPLWLPLRNERTFHLLRTPLRKTIVDSAIKRAYISPGFPSRILSSIRNYSVNQIHCVGGFRARQASCAPPSPFSVSRLFKHASRLNLRQWAGISGAPFLFSSQTTGKEGSLTHASSGKTRRLVG